MKKANVIYLSKPTEDQKKALELKYDKVIYHRQPKKDKEQSNLYNYLSTHWVDMVFTEFCDMYNLALDASRAETLFQAEYPTGCPDTSHVYYVNTHGEIHFPYQ